jgi:methyl-accepting chemotaxis protein
MLTILHNFKIGVRIWLAIFIPVAGMLLFSGVGLVEKYVFVAKMEQLERLVDLGPAVGNLAHEMQKERGTSAGFIGSKGEKFRDRLPERRADTDAKRAAFEAAARQFGGEAEGGLGADLAAISTALAELPAKRAAIDALALTAPAAADYYTVTIAKLLALVERMAGMSEDVGVSKAITAYTQILHGKERSGQERAMGSAGFAAGKFDALLHRRVTQLIARQETFFATFNAYATDGQKAKLAAVLGDPASKEVDRLRQFALDNPFTGDTGGVDAPVWFDTITKKIDLLKQVEDECARDLRTLADRVAGQTRRSFNIYLAATLVLAGAGIAIAWLIAADISRPLAKVTGAMGLLSSGDTGTVAEGAERRDEIGDMARAVEVFRQGLMRADDLARQQQEEREAKDRRGQVIDQLLKEFNLEVTEVLEIMTASATEMEATSRSMSATAEITTSEATLVAAAVEDTAAKMRSLAETAARLANSVDDISRRVGESADVALGAQEKVKATNVSVRELSRTVGKIGEIVGLINDIASQTNLLALNATIEAARAGDAGKGFAVVAGEVKQLASQTARATEEITAQIAAVQNETRVAVKAIGEITGVIERMSDIASGIAGSVALQDAATAEIASNVQQVAQATGEVSVNVSSVNHAAEETGRASGDVLKVSAEVAHRAVALREQVDTFLRNIRTA